MVHTAGTLVPPGRYRRLGGWGRVLDLPDGGVLPPSFDGEVALYAPLAPAAALEMAR